MLGRSVDDIKVNVRNPARRDRVWYDSSSFHPKYEFGIPGIALGSPYSS